MTPLLLQLDTDLPLFEPLRHKLNAEAGLLAHRYFPDGESYLRVDSPVQDRPCMILANLLDPDTKFLPLAFLATTLKELGAGSVGLVAPYLCYMRQDRRFADGEAITSKVFAELVSGLVDWLVTVDPHLHRYRDLREIYRIPAFAVQSTPSIARWLAQQNEELLLVGPDAESRQWVEAIARRIDQPFAVGEKQRRGDRKVTVTLPDLSAYRQRTVVVVDDVISSGHTLLETIDALKNVGFERIDCAAVHGIFADAVYETLQQRGIRRLVTTNSIPHPSNAVDLSDALVAPIERQLSSL